MSFVLSFLIILASLFAILSGIWVCTGLFMELRHDDSENDDEANSPVKIQKYSNS